VENVIITQTPLRIGLVGGGTDLPAYSETHGGLTLSAAIDKYIYVIVNRRFDNDIVLNYSRKEVVSRVDDIEHALIREAMRLTGVERGVEITTLADITSAGSGLGSSSTVTVGLLNALHTFQGRQVPALELAAQACEIEIDRCGKPIGRQDQYIAALGGVQALRFGPGGAVTAEEVQLDDYVRSALQRQVMLFYTGSRCTSADNILASQRARIESIRPHLDQLHDLAEFTLQQLSDGDPDSIGDAIRESWEAKRKLGGGVSGYQIELAISRALDAGASGAKICGAGGGGFLLVFCTTHYQNEVRTALYPIREMPVRLDRYGTRVVLNIAQGTWS
jgi:D-glycero-alpha-D-manno-heptose-7-phosphate kinase